MRTRPCHDWNEAHNSFTHEPLWVVTHTACGANKRHVGKRPHRLMKTSSNSSWNVAINIPKWLHRETNEKGFTYLTQHDKQQPHFELHISFIVFHPIKFTENKILLEMWLNIHELRLDLNLAETDIPQKTFFWGGEGAVPWVPEVFSHLRRGASFRRPTRVRGKPETAHEKPLAPRVGEQRHIDHQFIAG